MEENESKIILIEGWTADKVLLVLREKVFHSSVWLQPLESVSGGVWFYLAVVCLCCYIYSRLIKYGSEADNIWAKASKERIGTTSPVCCKQNLFVLLTSFLNHDSER